MALTEEEIVFTTGLLSRSVRLAGGARAHYMTAGETGPGVVLLHGGLPGSSGAAGWRQTAPFLGAHGFRVYCPDMPAYGLADNRPEHWPTGPASHVDFLHEFTTALCLDRFHLAGNSMGTINAVNYVLAHPERVLSFALIAGGVGDIVDGDRPEGSVDVPMFDGTVASMRKALEALTVHPETITDDLVEMRTRAALRNAEAFMQFFPRLLQSFGPERENDPDTAARLSTRGRLDRLTIPGIYLYGRQDVLAPVEYGYAQEDALPNVQFFYPDDCGHQGQSDQPDMFNQLFLEFFGPGRVSRTTAERAGVSTRRPELGSILEEA